MIKTHRRHRRRPDGQRHRPCLRAGGLRRACSPTSSQAQLDKAVGDDRPEHRPPGRSKARSGPRTRKRALTRITTGTDFKPFADCDLVIEAATENEEIKNEIFKKLCAGPAGRRDPRHQHLVDLDHAPRRRDRPARQVHRHALHEPGAGDEAGRADPRHRHRRGDLPRGARARGQAGQERRSPPRTSRPSSSTASCCR